MKYLLLTVMMLGLGACAPANPSVSPLTKWYGFDLRNALVWLHQNSVGTASMKVVAESTHCSTVTVDSLSYSVLGDCIGDTTDGGFAANDLQLFASNTLNGVNMDATTLVSVFKWNGTGGAGLMSVGDYAIDWTDGSQLDIFVGSRSFVANLPLQPNAKTSLVITFNNATDTLTVFVNGKPVTMTKQGAANATTLYGGNFSFGYSPVPNFGGTLYSAAVLSGVLTADQMGALHCTLNQTYGTGTQQGAARCQR